MPLSTVHYVPERLQCEDKAPVTDEEWAVALELYGKDRDDPLYHSAPPLSGPPSPIDDIDENENNLPSTSSDSGECFTTSINNGHSSSSLGSSSRRYFTESRSQSTSQIKKVDHDSDSDANRNPPTRPRNRRHLTLIPRRGMTASDDEDDVDAGADSDTAFGAGAGAGTSTSTSTGTGANVDPSINTSMRARKLKAFGVGGTIGAPPVCGKADVDRWDAAGERKRLREFYEKEGWLPGPEPAYRTKIRRRQVIRRLGLTGNADDDVERRRIISAYMEMAQEMFDVETVGFGLLREDGGYRYSMDPDTPPLMCPHEGVATSHVVLSTHQTCTVIADLSRDWRTRNNPQVVSKGGRAKFMAGAPLLYSRLDPPVVFGALMLFDSKARDTFSQREQGMLMRLSNMLVFQLATFQSEVMAERAAHMYEQSLAFLRRAVVPPRTLDPHEPTPRKGDAQGIASRRDKKRSKRERDDGAKSKSSDNKPSASASTPTSASPGPAAPPRRPSSGDSEPPPLVTKTGPREQQDFRKKSDLNNTDLYQDATDTLRGILGADAVAMYDMEDYQLFFRRTDAPDMALDRATSDITKPSPLYSFMKGEPWPANLQPIVHHVPTALHSRNPILGVSVAQRKDKDNSDGDEEVMKFDFGAEDIQSTISQLIVEYLTNRRFWWHRDSDSALGRKVAAMFPSQTQTLLVTFMFTFDGQVRNVTLAAWDKPSSKFEDSSTLSLPFIQVLGGLGVAALTFRKVRSMEQSQISYSNLQAHELRTPLHQILAITQLLRSAMLDLAETPPSCSSYLNSVQQIRDLIPILDAIDTSGKTLHGIVDNILSFLDLKARDYSTPDTPSSRIFDSPTGGARSLIVMLEDVIQEAHEENERSRRSALMPLNAIETVLEIEPRELGEDYSEDAGGALRRALGKILSNAYKFIEGEGCVEIRVTDPSGAAPEGCHGVCRTRRIQLEITDNGPGMDSKFVRDHLGEPWAKQHAFTTGSGLSVHLAYRIIDLMGGHMEIRSAPNRGCVVKIEVPLESRRYKADAIVDSPEAINTARDPLTRGNNIQGDLIKPLPTVALVGFNIPERHRCGLPRLGETITRLVQQNGARIVPLPEAEMIIANGEVEEMEQGKLMMEHAYASEIVFLTMPGHDPHPDVLDMARKHSRVIRRIAKPVTPSVIRHVLHPPPTTPATRTGQHIDFAYSSPESLARRGSLASVSSGGDRMPRTPPVGLSFGAGGAGGGHVQSASLSSIVGLGIAPGTPSQIQPPRSILVNSEANAASAALRVKSDTPAPLTPPLHIRPGGVVPEPRKLNGNGTGTSNGVTATGGTHTPASSGNWKPKGMCMEEAIANLCLGDYFSSARRVSLRRTISNTSSGRDSHASEGTSADGTSVDASTPATSHADIMSPGYEKREEEEEEEEEEEVKVKVLVVEDNMINRKILVKILSTKLPIEIHEAVDGVDAIEAFKEFTGPSIVLLDINMPRKDGFEACAEMRALEKDNPNRARAQIIAVTALSADEEKRHGQEVGFDKWAVKPCGKATITKLVQDARRTLLGIRDEIETDLDLRRYTM